MNIGGSNLFSSLINTAATAALASMTGGTSLLVQAALKSVMSAIGDQVLQQVGQQLGLPQSAIDLAQSGFHLQMGDAAGAASNLQDAIGGLNSAVGGSPFDAGQLNDAAQAATKQLIDFATSAAKGSDDAVGAGSGKDSFLVAFAKALGKAMDSKMGKMIDISKKIDQQTQSANSNNKSPVISELSAELQGLSQEVSILSAAMSNSIKSIGEASSQLARKG